MVAMPRRADDNNLRITRLKLSNWRNFRHAETDLAPRAFLVGPNASGKSNFLDAIRFLHDVVAVGGGFENAVLARGGVRSLRCLAARQNSDIEVEVDLGNDDTPTVWRYHLQFNQTSQRRPLLKAESVHRDGSLELERPDTSDRSDPARLSQTYLEQVNVNRPFRAIADFLRTVRYLHIVPQLVRDPERSLGRTDDPYGGDFLKQLGRTQTRTRDARLRRIVAALKVAVPQLQELKLERDARGVDHLQGRYEHWRPHGAWQSEADFSDGTLRLLGLLWAVLDGSGPLLLEEPELSLHPEVVRYIPQMFARMQTRTRRQVLVSTQSSELLGDEGIGLDEVLLLMPHPEGTVIQPAAELREIRELLHGGLSVADAVLPRTRPEHAEQLSFFPKR